MNDFNVNDEFDVIRELGFMRDDGQLREGDLAIVFADANGNKMCGVVLEDVPESPPQDERLRALTTLAEAAEHTECAGVLVATRRAGASEVRGDDLAWNDALIAVAERFRLVPHGVYVATHDAVTRVQPLTNAA